MKAGNGIFMRTNLLKSETDMTTNIDLEPPFEMAVPIEQLDRYLAMLDLCRDLSAGKIKRCPHSRKISRIAAKPQPPVVKFSW